VAACGSDSTKSRPEAINLPDGVSELFYEDGEKHWTQDERFVWLASPIAVPSNHVEGEQVRVYAHIPEGAFIERKDGHLRLPPGSEIDRLEWVRWGEKRSLADVRGTRIDANGVAWDHTLRRTRLAPDTAMIGYEWRALDPDANQAGTDTLIERATGLPPAQGMKPDAQTKYLSTIRKKNDCGRCHQAGRPDASRRGEHGIVSRGTDGTRFFTTLDVLNDTRVLEGYGKHDPNRSREAVTIRCGDEVLEYPPGDDARVRCTGRQVAVGHYDGGVASRSEPARHAAVCTARRYLIGHMREPLKSEYIGLLANCD
jgi:hypothetical protein